MGKGNESIPESSDNLISIFSYIVTALADNLQTHLIFIWIC